MLNYDFLNLSPSEFENLVRDLLQTRPGIFIESFADGADGGIDFRYTKNGERVIVQCKRYKAFDNLWAVLGKELKNMHKQKPDKYILATSVDLLKHQKEQIYQFFKEFMPTAQYVLGRKDINSLLTHNPNIEKQHYKLWLSSTAVLEQIIQSKVINQSAFEIDKIKKMVNLYVENDSFREALGIINKSNYVVISGIPGIGKTTLARVLSYYLLSNGYQEFVFISGTTGEGMSNFKEGRKQVFFFDDFLGKNFLKLKPSINEGSLLLRFVHKIAAAKDKVLILTTREYILNQGKEVFEELENNSINFNKCVLDLDKYSSTIKAKILVNHLYFSDLPRTHCEALLEKKYYLKLINHRNYNPRIIETVVENKLWEQTLPSEFGAVFLNALENPESIWQKAYETQISMLSRCILAILATTGTPIYNDFLEEAVKKFSRDHFNAYGFVVNPFNYSEAIRELHNSFIITQQDQEGQVVVNFINPSISDFLTGYLGRETAVLIDVIKSALYFNQLGGIYVVKGEKVKSPSWFFKTGKIEIDQNIAKIIREKVTTDYDSLTSSAISQYDTQSGFAYFITDKDQFSKISILSDPSIFEMLPDQLFQLYLAEKLSGLIATGLNSLSERTSFVDAVEKLNNYLIYKPEELIRTYLQGAYHMLDFDLLVRLKAVVPNAAQHIKEDERFQSFVEQACSSGLTDFKPSDLSYVNTRLTLLQKELDVDVSQRLEVFAKRSEDLAVEMPEEEKVKLDNLKIEQKKKKSQQDNENSRIFERLMDKEDG
ncbi:restriction endonuclease [Pedobacter miscanthi]|uniref:Uncharacterized protein n=1 Tax=Pedobacter miscanthi TaxID=2259170 RepID=A0A366LCD6_9SPHI|nr:restriction endonuclease [Pedobacter miscanthi]RBQ11548.1 hypothetical protein DRW42_03545 [Pedobacter miscanthi]